MNGEAKVLVALHPLPNCTVQHSVRNMTTCTSSFRSFSLFCSNVMILATEACNCQSSQLLLKSCCSG